MLWLIIPVRCTASSHGIYYAGFQGPCRISQCRKMIHILPCFRKIIQYVNFFFCSFPRLRLSGQDLRLECQMACSRLSTLAAVSVCHPERGPLTLAYTIGEDLLPAPEQVGLTTTKRKRIFQ